MHWTCKSCGARHKIIVVLEKAETDLRRQQFQFAVPTGLFSAFIHRVVHNRPLPIQLPEQPDITVRVERKVSPRQMLIDELRVPATPRQLYMLAIIYVEQRTPWSRDNTQDGMNVSQTWHNKMAKAFFRLGFLKKIRHNRYCLTADGEMFLSHFLSDTPLSHSVWDPKRRGGQQTITNDNDKQQRILE